jgi:hypothetical protein
MVAIVINIKKKQSGGKGKKRGEIEERKEDPHCA